MIWTGTLLKWGRRCDRLKEEGGDIMKNIGIMIAGIMGILGSILIIVAAIAGDRFPNWLYLVAAVCMLANTVALILNYRELKKKREKAEEKK